jgi:hypothetical protein
MSDKLAIWLVIGGIGVDLIDMITTAKGTSGGVFYGPNGYLKGLAFGKFTAGEAVAAVGAGMLLLKKV